MEMRISAVMVVLEQAAASQATVSSKNRVCRAAWRAHGTAATTTPCSGRRGRGLQAAQPPT